MIDGAGFRPRWLFVGSILATLFLNGIASARSATSAGAPAPSARPPLPSERDTWIRVEMAHFTLISNASRRRTLDLGKRLERFRAVLANTYKTFRVDPPVPIIIYVFKNDASFLPYKGRFNDRPMNMAGVFVDRPDGYYIAMNGDPGLDPLDVIYHEYTHQFLNNNLSRPPVWFNEGLAECFETFQADDDSASIGRLQNRHVLLLRSRALMPLRELFAMTQESPDYNEGERQGIFYAQSWVLVHYLMFDRPARRPQLGEFLDRLRRREDVETAFATSFLTTFRGLEDELRDQVAQTRFQFTVLKYSDLTVDTSARVSPMTREESLARLGDLLLHTQPERAAEAEAIFQEALRLHPQFAPGYAGLGLARSLADRTDEAVTYFEKAVAAEAGDAITHFHLGECLARRAREQRSTGSPGGIPADLARAQEAFGKAIELRADFAEAYLEYARTIVGAGGNAASAIHLLEAARTLLPARADVVTNLVLLYARQGDRVRARDLIDRSLANMIGHEEVEAVRELAGVDTKSGPSETKSDEPAAASAVEYSRQVAVYNQAVDRGNRGDDAGAIAMLQSLLKDVSDPDLRRQVGEFLETLKKEAALRRKPPR